MWADRQYEGLERLQEHYGARGFTVLGVPCNQFAGQEPGTPEEIQEVAWNLEKFLISPAGETVARFRPRRATPPSGRARGRSGDPRD